MKRIIRLFVMLLVLGALAGMTASCAFLSNSHVQKLETFKHKQPLPKKYIINNGYKPIAK